MIKPKMLSKILSEITFMLSGVLSRIVILGSVLLSRLLSSLLSSIYKIWAKLWIRRHFTSEFIDWNVVMSMILLSCCYLWPLILLSAIPLFVIQSRKRLLSRTLLFVINFLVIDNNSVIGKVLFFCYFFVICK